MMPASVELLHRRAAQTHWYTTVQLLASLGNSRHKPHHLQQSIPKKSIPREPGGVAAAVLILPPICSCVGALLSHRSHPPKKTSVITGSRFIVGSRFIIGGRFIAGSRVVSVFHRMPAFSRRWCRKTKDANTTHGQQRTVATSLRAHFCGNHSFSPLKTTINR